MGIRSDDRCGRDFGTDHVQHTTCGKGSCCSSHGWCGTTAPQHRPSTSPRPDQPRRPLHPAPRPPARRPRTRRRCGTSEEYCSVALGCQNGCWPADPNARPETPDDEPDDRYRHHMMDDDGGHYRDRDRYDDYRHGDYHHDDYHHR